MKIRPERGGRIVSLRLDGEELLDQGIGVDKPNAAGFVEGGAFGWDEMVPNVDATETLPDHGEAWRLPWEVIDGMTMRCRGQVVPWELERRIDIGESIELAYRYTNAGGKPHLAYWCAHPLFKLEPGMAMPSVVPLPRPGKSSKVFLPKGSLDRVELRWGSGAGVELRWDRLLTPYVGIWVSNGDIGGYRQVAIEPATGGNDKPDPAAPPPLLQPGESYSWWLRLTAL
jgi:galactose mutarotase-like enzyme